MAKAQNNLPTAFIDSLDAGSALLDAAAEGVLQAGAGVVEPRLWANLTATIGQGAAPSRSTGQLLGALGTTAVRVNPKSEHNLKIGFAENRRDGRSNTATPTSPQGRSLHPPDPKPADQQRKR